MLKRIPTIMLLLLSLTSVALSNGVAIVDASSAQYLNLLESDVNVTIENQVAITVATQTFKNISGSDQTFKYAFPLNDQASAVSLRWNINDQWLSASFSASPQDTSMTGGGSGGDIDANLKTYLGATPLYFDISDTLKRDSLIIFELTYVEFLPYEYGNVTYTYPNDYSLIQNTILNKQQLDLTVISERNIESIELQEIDGETISNDGNTANINLLRFETFANSDYNVRYSLDLNELGLFGFSTFLVDSLVPDKQDQGFFTFVAEPDPGESTSIINKVFTLIIDRSGSMYGDKIIQARNAATFIVEHLNEGDKFNIVDFSSDISSFETDHVDYNSVTESAAITYISNLIANGSTNISSAFSEAIPQFSAANDSTANIIIFFTDGQATVGITSTTGIVSHVHDLVTSTETNLMIHTFGIGSYANEQLLTLIASDNQGLAEFLGEDELEDRITSFYLKIRNPVLLNTEIAFTPDIISEVYPAPLPSLYIGQQMIVAGRYSASDSVTVTLSGEAFGQPVEYSYELSLTDSSRDKYQFLPKIWAKKKIEHLLVEYYKYSEDSPEALGYKEEIVSLSLLFGIITQFTSFSEDQPTGIEEFDEAMNERMISSFTLLGNYPNPFNPSTTIKFHVSNNISGVMRVNIYSSSGKLVKVLFASVNGVGDYEIFWDGTSMNGVPLPSGTYVYVMEMDNTLLSGKMTLLK
jgi:Ca-activated chloride channel homolog